MVYIKRIDLRGFKTFKRKVSLSLDHGLTVITGPNGSGKSNILDAVKFALGELSSKELRGSTFEDVVSKASGPSKARSAYVAIQFDNSDRRIPIDSDNVTISREYVSGGEGVYRLNGKRTSRRQLTDVLSSAGITVSGLNLVPQHTVTRLADVTAEERRRVIEEMIGIGVYDMKKEEAKVHLQQADLNIRVATAKIEEVRMRVEALERERNNLLRSRFLREEVKRLKGAKIVAEVKRLDEAIRAYKRRVEEAARRLSELKDERERLRGEKRRIEGERVRFEREVGEVGERRLFQLERRLGSTSAEVTRLEMEVETGRRRLRELEEEGKKVEARLSEVEEEIQILQGKATTLKEGLKEAKALIEGLEEEKRGLQSEISAAKGKTEGSYKRLEDLNDAINKTLQEEARLSSILEVAEAKRTLLLDQLEKLEERLTQSNRTLKTLDIEVEEGKRTLVDMEDAEGEIEEKIRRYGNILKVREGELQDASRTADKARSILHQMRAETKLLETINPEERAIKAIEERGRVGEIEGGYGRLRSLIDYDEGYEAAIEVASTGWLNAYVVEDLDAAISCIATLKKMKLGRLKIIPLSNVSTVKPLPNLEGEEVIGRAVDLIRCDDKFRPAVNFVFGDTVITKGQKSAFKLSLKGVRAVAIQGDLFEPEGGIETGYYRKPSLYLDAATPIKEIENLERMIDNLERIISKSRVEVERVRGEIENLKLEKREKREAIRRLKEELEEEMEERRSLEEERGRLIQEVEASKREAERLKIEADEARRRLTNLKGTVKNLYDERERAKEEAYKSPIKTVEAKMSEVNSRLEEAREHLIKIQGEHTTTLKTLTILEENRSNLEGRVSGVEEETRQLMGRVEESERRLHQGEEELKRLEEERSRLMRRVDEVKEERRRIEAEQSKIDERMNTLYQAYEEASTELSEATSKLRELEMERAFHHRELQGLGVPPETQPIEDASRLDDLIEPLLKELDEIGAVNELAESQYAEYMENYRHLSTRINTLEEERRSILRFMAELDEKKRNAFMNAFKRVNDHFAKIFSQITGGGTGRLVLEVEDDPFQGGVEVLLSFPGKPEFSVSGASGGEKSVATVCFILALQSINPMPFYIFDEIDAHLDPLNSQRLADLLKERSKGSQFIVISLKDSMIAKADKVYGVYLEDGSTRVLTLPLEEVHA